MNLAETNTGAVKAFSRQSGHFDAIDKENPVIQWMRKRVYNHLKKFLSPNSQILELNAGTGIDALWLASQGHHVLATDASGGMISELRQKALARPHANNIEVRQCSFLELDQLNRQGFDHVFSNFGGLNCTNELGTVAEGISKKLVPGGKATLVMIAPFCPWEMAHVLKGNFKLAFRRWNTKGASAHLEGIQFKSYYHSAHRIRKLFGDDFQVCGLESLGFFTPPPYHQRWALKNPRLLGMLQQWDESVARFPFFRSRGDHYIITLKKHQA